MNYLDKLAIFRLRSEFIAHESQNFILCSTSSQGFEFDFGFHQQRGIRPLAYFNELTFLVLVFVGNTSSVSSHVTVTFASLMLVPAGVLLR